MRIIKKLLLNLNI